MSTCVTTLASWHPVPAETRPSGSLLRLLPLMAALPATPGALATGVLDRPAAASAPPRLAPVADQVPGTAVGRDPSVPDAASVLFGREAQTDEPVATF
jgi:hypothetical protein